MLNAFGSHASHESMKHLATQCLAWAHAAEVPEPSDRCSFNFVMHSRWLNSDHFQIEIKQPSLWFFFNMRPLGPHEFLINDRHAPLNLCT